MELSAKTLAKLSSWGVLGSYLPSQVAEFNGRVAIKNRKLGPAVGLGQLAAARGSESGAAAWSHRSTRAGGQDDGSSKQTPSK